MGQMSRKSWLREIYDRRRIRIRIENKMRINRAGWAYSVFLMT